MLPLCLDQGVGCIPWSPLARGRLTGSRTRDQKNSPRQQNDAYGEQIYTSDQDYDVADRVQDIAKERGLPPAQIALAWLLGNPAITAPIVGATKLHHLDDAIAAVEVTLTAEERRRLEEPYQPHPISGII